MKRIKCMNGYAIYEAAARDVDKYGYEAGCFYVFFSSDVRDFGIANSDPEFDGVGTLEAAEACCCGNYAKAREIVEARTTAASFEEIVEVEQQLDAGLIDDDGQPIDDKHLDAGATVPAPFGAIMAAGIQNSVVVQGNTAGTLIVNVGCDRTLSEEEGVLLRILGALSVRGRTQLLSYDFALEEKYLAAGVPAVGLPAGSRGEALTWN